MRLGFRWWHSLALCLFERAVFANPWKMDYANLLPPMPTKTSRARRRSSAAEFYVDPEALAASVAASEAANHAPASSILGAISRNPDPNIVAQLCGFDPLDLLNTVDFPNDRYERLLKISREARQLAMRREDIPLSNGDVEEVGAFIGSSRPGTSGKLLEQVLEPTTKFSLDAKEGIRVEEISAEAANEAISEAKQKEIEVLKEQLARSAASITIQALFRGYLIRRKYVSVKFHKMTIDSVDTESYPKLVSGLPGVLNLTIQERLIKKYETFGRIYESIYSFLPDFPYFCAAKIQAVFRMYIFRRKWLYFQAMSWEEKDGLIGREAKNAIIRRAERATYKVNTYVRAVIRIQKAWKSYSCTSSTVT
ncbi:hypothetical protein BC830DRAFT_355414 [Chytriomyces sp. MP71]|nr:hypothetical protein BC830DRAFT_355414 [Chytriomyces sp. MP71]